MGPLSRAMSSRDVTVTHVAVRVSASDSAEARSRSEARRPLFKDEKYAASVF